MFVFERLSEKVEWMHCQKFLFLSFQACIDLWPIVQLPELPEHSSANVTNVMGAPHMMTKVQGRAKKILLSSVTHVPSGLMGCPLAA